MGIRAKIKNVFKRRKQVKLSEKEELRWVSDLEKNINYPNNLNSDILLQFAKDNFVYIKDSTKDIEKKADDLIKYLAIGTGLLGFLVNSSPVFQLTKIGWKFICGGFLSWLIALLTALATRYLSSYRYPENIRYMFEVIQSKGNDPNTLRTAMAISYEKARISHLYRGKKKSFFLKCSYSFLILAIVLISLSMLVTILSLAAH
jgi:hypothetical protein